MVTAGNATGRALRIGFVGAGGIARRHVDALQLTGGAAVTDVVELDPSRAAWMVEMTGARFCKRVAELVGRVDAAYVVTPPRVRREAVRILAEAGVPIFCEKPLAADLEDASAIAGIARATGVPFMMGFMRRWHEPTRAFRDLVRSGRVGTPIQYFRQRIGHLEIAPANWRKLPTQLCGVTMESASHDIDMLRWIAGDVVAATGQVQESRPELPGFDETMAATLRFSDGASGVLQVSWQSRVQRNVLGVIGTLGSAVLEGPGLWTTSTLTVSTTEGTTTERLPETTGADDEYVRQAAAFLRLVRGEAVEHADADDGRATVAVSSRILASSTAPASLSAP